MDIETVLLIGLGIGAGVAVLLFGGRIWAGGKIYRAFIKSDD